MEQLARLAEETERNEMERLQAMQQVTAQYGLSLDAVQLRRLAACHRQTLRDTGRVALMGGILPDLVWTFCDSPYVWQAAWEEDLAALMEIFYAKKGESGEAFSDAELLRLMRRYFDGMCGALGPLRDATPAMLLRGPIQEAPQRPWEEAE